MEHPAYCVYVLFSEKDFHFYIGFTENFERRMKELVDGKTISTAPRRPFIPLLCEYHFAKEDAIRGENYFKTTAGKKTLRLMLQESLKKVWEINMQ